MRRNLGAVQAACLLLPLWLGWAGPGGATEVSPSPPALDRDFPDPDVIRAGDGTYYAYATGHEDARGVGRRLSVSQSRDLVHWTAPRDPIAGPAPWARPGTTYWAPHVVLHAGRYLLFYAAAAGAAGEDRYRIGLATSANPAGPFEDRGPIEADDAAVNIDPMLFEDPASGRAYLYWGRNGVITAREMRSDRLGFAPASRPVDVLAPRPGRPFESVVEAPFVVAANGFYFLFYSGDDCCRKPHYAVMVARSRSPLGPFERLGDLPGRNGDGRILQASSRWRAPGHCSVFRDAGGRWWIAYAAIDRRRPLERRVLRRPMKIDPIDVSGGWPVVGRAR